MKLGASLRRLRIRLHLAHHNQRKAIVLSVWESLGEQIRKLVRGLHILESTAPLFNLLADPKVADLNVLALLMITCMGEPPK